MYILISFLGVLRLKKKELRTDQCRHTVFDRTRDEDDALFQKPRKNIIGPFAAVGLFDHHRHQIHHCINRIAHLLISQSMDQQSVADSSCLNMGAR
jgi:hypothetical protein